MMSNIVCVSYTYWTPDLMCPQPEKHCNHDYCHGRAWDDWDQQIYEDCEAGILDELIDEAKNCTEVYPL